MRRRVAALVAAVATVGVLAIGPAPAGAAPAAGAAACAFAPTSIAIVVDFGDASPVSTMCIPADSTDSGLDVLAARAAQLGTPSPRFNSSGLLCGIDGVPSEGCGEPVGSKYAYWSYWHGSGGVWTYASVGPSGRAHSTTVEGWRYQPQGAANPSDPPPRASADPAATCAPPPPSTAPPTSAASSPGTSGTQPRSPTSSSSSSGAAVVADATTMSSSTGTSEPASSSSSTASGGQQVAAGSVRINAREKRGGSVWGLAAGGGLMAALGLGGAVIGRRRRASL